MESIQKNDPGVMSLEGNNRSSYYATKRLLDIFGAMFMLAILSPLMLLIAISILIYSPGPILFVQERVGTKRRFQNGRLYWGKEIFKIYKFRTMKVNSDPSIHKAYVKALIENDSNQMATLQGEKTETRKLIHDSRITRPGAFLRKYSLDELPQFWNVLRGDMSLVGPRPAIPYEVEMYRPWHCQRLEAQSGITGLQQVEARCTTDFDQQVRFDIEYIEKQSFWLDLKIILKTISVVISTKGAH